MKLTASVLLLALLWAPGAAFAGIWDLELGVQAPVGGVLLDDDAVKKITEEVRTARSLASINETLKAQLAAKDKQISELESQVASLTQEARAREIAMAIAEDRDKRRQEIEGQYVRIIEQQAKTLDRSEKAIDRAIARIETLEKRAFWMQVLAPLGILGAFGAGLFLH